MIKGLIKFNEPLARYTSWRVGGPAERFFKPSDMDDLSRFLKTLPEDEPIVWLGLGSNVLIRDKGIAGTVIYTQGRLKGLSQAAPQIVRAEAGVTCAKLAKFCAKTSLSGGTFFAGIPGTVGGALAMNAGAFGSETWPCVVAVEMMNRQGKLTLRQPEEFKYGYREVVCPEEEWFVAGHFGFAQGESAEAKAEIRALLRKRSDTQPIGELNCGSVFRNPPSDHAARLIEASGLKGERVGAAVVSEKHANFIINEAGRATALDIERLILHVADTVEAKQGVRLEREVRIIGEV